MGSKLWDQSYGIEAGNRLSLRGVRVNMTDGEFDEREWTSRLRNHRAGKDEFFEGESESPIPAEERDDFDGLEYFSLDPDFRFDARWEPRENPDTVTLGATTGPDMEFDHVGNVGFEADGDFHVLQVFQSPGVEDMFVPFRDATNGTQTWQHGRYLTIDPPSMSDQTPIILDFNLAYHPFCVYHDTYVCAIPPKENELPFAVRAGERR